MGAGEIEAIGTMFEVLAEGDFRGVSPLYERLARDAAGDPEVLALLLPATPRNRLPHLLFSAVKYLLAGEGSDPVAAFGAEPYAVFRSWCLDHRAAVEDLVATRVIQTNEVGRCAALLPCLAVVAEAAQRPLALVEVGASGGLNLRLDRYRYVYGEVETGPADAAVVLRPEMRGPLVPPLAVPPIAWRRGLDRSPIDITDDDAVAWLRACIWPEQHARVERLDAAVADARRDPPTVVAGDAAASIAAVVAEAPADAALCVVHTAFIAYLPDPGGFVDQLVALSRERPLWWVSGEAPGLVAPLPVPPAPAPTTEMISFLYGVVPLGPAGDGPATGQPSSLARAGSHGTWLEWLGPR
jgi:hypothetical protein